MSPRLRNFAENSFSLTWEGPRAVISHGNISMPISQQCFLEFPRRQFLLELWEALWSEGRIRSCVFEFQVMEFVR